MNKLLCFVAVPIVFLSACATVEPVKVANGGSAKTYFCTKNRLSPQGENLLCNWADSASTACRSNNLGTLEKSAVVSGPESGGRCETGDWLVKVTTK